MRSHESIIESVERTVPSARDSNAVQTGWCDECGRQHACVKGEGRDKYVASSRDSSDPSIAVRLYNVNEWIHVQLQLCWATLLATFCMNWVTHVVYLQICSSMSCRMGEGALLSYWILRCRRYTRASHPPPTPQPQANIPNTNINAAQVLDTHPTRNWSRTLYAYNRYTSLTHRAHATHACSYHARPRSRQMKVPFSVEISSKPSQSAPSGP